ncbi:MAG: hypothetical protein ABSC92_02585 [Rhizomicrobium sp.]
MNNTNSSKRPVLSNNTRNQHFLTRVEQKLNARNPNALPENAKIYSFRVVDRTARALQLEDPNGRSIRSNLSALDLFSFDVDDGSDLRSNFETLFAKYEASIEVHTRNLLAKLPVRSKDIKSEVIDLFAAKLLNFVRNPYCVQKVLNTFPRLTTYQPTDPTLLAAYHRIVSGKRPHQAHLCAELGITDQMYVEWLRTLFMLLFPDEKHPNLFEGLIKSLIENPKTHTSVLVFDYDDKFCLMSDRSYCEPMPDGKHMAFSFNLCRHAFVHYIFADIDDLTQNMPRQDIVQRHRASLSEGLNVGFEKNHLKALAMYNARVIEQCHERVFCASKQFDVFAQPFV